MPFTPIHKCSICSRTFARKGDERRHNQTEHDPNVRRVFCPYPEGIRLDFSSSEFSPTISWTRPNPEFLPCHGSAKIGQETNLTTHMLKHVGYRWYCPVCHISYSDRATLSRHEHKWSSQFRTEQREVQQTLLMRGENWLGITGLPSLAARVWGALGSVASAVTGLRGLPGLSADSGATRTQPRTRATYQPYASPHSRRVDRLRSPAPSPPSSSSFSDPPSPNFSMNFVPEDLLLSDSPLEGPLSAYATPELTETTPPGSPSSSTGSGDWEFERLIDPELLLGRNRVKERE